MAIHAIAADTDLKFLSIIEIIKKVYLLVALGKSNDYEIKPNRKVYHFPAAPVGTSIIRLRRGTRGMVNYLPAQTEACAGR
jgi:hypothetical protein